MLYQIYSPFGLVNASPSSGPDGSFASRKFKVFALWVDSLTMTAQEPSSLDALEPRAPTRRLGVLRFQHQVNAIDELIHDYDPAGVGSAPGDDDDIYEGAAVDVMRALRDSESSGLDAAVAVKTVLPQASHELVTKIVAAWQAG